MQVTKTGRSVDIQLGRAVMGTLIPAKAMGKIAAIQPPPIVTPIAPSELPACDSIAVKMTRGRAPIRLGMSSPVTRGFILRPKDSVQKESVAHSAPIMASGYKIAAHMQTSVGVVVYGSIQQGRLIAPILSDICL